MKKIITIIALAAIATNVAIAGTITGIVTDDSNGQPIAGIWVYALKYNTGEYSGGGSTNPDGFYSIGFLAAGTYRVAVSTAGTEFVQEYYNNAFNYEAATAVDVPASGVVENIDFGLAVGGSITGTVRDANGNLLDDIPINAHCDALNYGRMEHSNADGIYELTGLPAGTYRVELATWDASSGNYAKQYYDHTIYWEQATLVHVQPGQEITGIDFDLMEGASLYGYVKDPNGSGVEDTEIAAFIDNQWFTNTFTDVNGFYILRNLMAEITYKIAAYPPDSTDYMITRIFVNIPDINDYTAPDIYLQTGALTVSGKVTDKITSLPIAGIWVSCHFDDLDLWGGRSQTDTNGMYTLTNLIPGEELEIWTEPPPQYARIGTEIELEYDINNMDFVLPPAATLSGKVIDALTAEPLVNIRIEYDNGRYNCWHDTFTDADGTFCLTQLPPGIAELKAMPDVESGYAWNLPWGGDLVCLGEGENQSQRIIVLKKGTLVRGYIKDADGNAVDGIEYDYSGRDCDGWGDTDVNGFYQIRLPVGIYGIALDDEELGALPRTVTITDINKDVNVPDMMAYTEEDGGQISGEVNNPGGYAKTGYFSIVACKAGTPLNDPNMWYTARSVAEAEMENAGPFSLNKLPPDANYDIYLGVSSQTPDEIISLAIRDSALNVAVGTTSIKLEYSSQGSTVTGGVKNTDDRLVLGAEVLLADSSNSFGGFGETDCSGQYVIYNIPAGTYTATAIHSKYLNTSTTVEVVEGTPVDVNTIVMPFVGEKEGADLNGDGEVDMLDVLEFSQDWLKSGLSEADFSQDSKVNFSDWVRMAENWQNEAIWYQE